MEGDHYRYVPADRHRNQSNMSNSFVDVNTMAMSLTSQVRAFGDITNAATDGDFTKLITVEASGTESRKDQKTKRFSNLVFDLQCLICGTCAPHQKSQIPIHHAYILYP